MRLGRDHDRRTVPISVFGPLRKRRHVLRQLHLHFGRVIAVVQADADDLGRVGDRRQQTHAVARSYVLVARRSERAARSIESGVAEREQLEQRRREAPRRRRADPRSRARSRRRAWVPPSVRKGAEVAKRPPGLGSTGRGYARSRGAFSSTPQHALESHGAVRTNHRWTAPASFSGVTLPRRGRPTRAARQEPPADRGSPLRRWRPWRRPPPRRSRGRARASRAHVSAGEHDGAKSRALPRRRTSRTSDHVGRPV